MSFVRFKPDTMRIDAQNKEVHIDGISLDNEGTVRSYVYVGDDVDRLIDQLQTQKRFGICFIFGKLEQIRCEATLEDSNVIRLENGDHAGLVVLLPENSDITFPGRIVVEAMVGISSDPGDDAWMLAGKIQSPAPSAEFDAGF